MSDAAPNPMTVDKSYVAGDGRKAAPLRLASAGRALHVELLSGEA